MIRSLRMAAFSAVIASSPAFAGGDWQCGAGFVSNSAEVEKFIAEKRAAGPAGLAEATDLFDFMKASADAFLASGAVAASSADGAKAAQSPQEVCARLAQIVDQVAGQRGATTSRLFWYTDLDQAKAAASESGKPILSLRMLGKLTDEYSCANSRFFRTTLYTNKEISDYLRDQYILHWQSVRPVPVVTIDFGDGRKLERTITGNSAHYLLDAEGRPMDVLPGLYGPAAFLSWLNRGVAMHEAYALNKGADNDRRLRQYHASCASNLDLALQRQLIAAAPEQVSDIPKDALAAMAAGRISASKARVEDPILAAVVKDQNKRQSLSDDVWQRIAALPGHVVELDAASREVIRQEHPTAVVAGARAPSKAIVEDPLARMVRQFERSISLDTVKNEYLLHRRIHDWFAAGEATADVDVFNERVYAELFLTPSSDPWLGLAPADAYTALDDGGLSTSDDSQPQLGAVR
jgi:hypothetical protein